MRVAVQHLLTGKSFAYGIDPKLAWIVNPAGNYCNNNYSNYYSNKNVPERGRVSIAKRSKNFFCVKCKLSGNGVYLKFREKFHKLLAPGA
jgi:hypothetical protein